MTDVFGGLAGVLGLAAVGGVAAKALKHPALRHYGSDAAVVFGGYGTTVIRTAENGKSIFNYRDMPDNYHVAGGVGDIQNFRIRSRRVCISGHRSDLRQYHFGDQIAVRKRRDPEPAR